MILILILLLALISAATIRESPLNSISDYNFFLHNQCLRRLPEQSIALPELKAIVCGENFSTLNSSQIFIASGLIHLFVVSGAHLIALKKIYNLITRKKLPEFIFLILITLYSAACSFNPPILRSYLTILVSYLFISKKIFWPPHFKLLIVGLVSLSVNFFWLKSLSLQMSWIISFVLILNAEYTKNLSPIIKQGFYFIFLIPILSFLQSPNILIVLTNLLLSGLLEFILFPLGLLVWIFPFFHPVFDSLVEFIKWLLTKLEFKYVAVDFTLPKNFTEFIWIYIFTIHLGFHLLYLNKKRKSNFL